MRIFKNEFEGRISHVLAAGRKATDWGSQKIQSEQP